MFDWRSNLSRSSLPAIYRRARQAGILGLVPGLVVIVILAGVAAVGAWPHAWPWVGAVTAVIAALVPMVAGQVTTANQRRSRAAQVTRRHIQGTRGPHGSELPTVAQLGMDELGVHRAVLTVPYIHRDKESNIRKLLMAGHPVLLVGSSMVGKTTTAATVIKDLYDDRRIVVPDSKDALAALDSIDTVLRETVIWLDDVNRLIGAGGITRGSLGRLVSSGNIVIATIRAGEYDRYRPSSGVNSPEWDVLSSFQRIFLDRELTEGEKERIAEAVHDNVVRERISRVGLGEYVGAAEQIDETLRLGPSVSPVGYALVRGAADWRRTGIDRPVPGSLLRVLATPYLARRRYELTVPEVYEAALGWATREINEEVSLLQQVDQDVFAVFDYALDLLSKGADPVPAETWRVVIDAATPAELLAIGYSAWVTYDSLQFALEAWNRAAESGDPNVSPRAIYNIAHMFRYEGRTDEAETLYLRAVDSTDRVIAASALSDLGLMKFQQGLADEAKSLYERVLGTYEDEWAKAVTRLRLGKLMARRDELDASRRLYELVLESGYYDLIPQAEIGFARIDLKEENPWRARSHFHKAINSGHPQYAPLAAFELGNLLTAYGQIKEACEAYEIAIQIWDEDISPPAAGMLGQLFEASGQMEAAQDAYNTAVKSGHSKAAPASALLLGKMLEQQDRKQEALKLYQQVTHSDSAELAAEATEHVMRLLGKSNTPD